MFNELVDKIVVYEAEGAGNARTQKVDIYFNYVGQVDIAYTEEELAELKAQKEQEERQRMEKQRKREKPIEKSERQRKSLKTVVRSLEQKRVRTAGRCLHLRATDSFSAQGNAGIRQDWSKRKRIEKSREELTTTGSAPVPCVITPTGLHTASRNFVPMSAEELTTTRKP